MSKRDVEQHVRLVDESGEAIPFAFVEVPGGLWDDERTRLTLFLHPGRVKSGLELGDDLGPVLTEGRTVRLQVGAEARDAAGRTLAAPAEVTWRVGPARRHALDPATWEVDSPKSPADDLRVHFPHALDAVLARREIAVEAGAGEPVPGAIELEAGETRWRFRPDRRWQPGRAYHIVVGAMLEDPSGNRPGRPFERKVGAEPVEVVRRLSFVVPD
jgi:hypothetical protein